MTVDLCWKFKKKKIILCFQCYVKASSFGRNLIPVDPREKEWLEWFVNNNTWVAKSQSNKVFFFWDQKLIFEK